MALRYDLPAAIAAVVLLLLFTGWRGRQAENKFSWLTTIPPSSITTSKSPPSSSASSFSPSSSPPVATPPWTIRRSPGRGLGLFATRHIPKHTRILAEEPQFVVRRPSSQQSASMLVRIRAAFNRLGPADQAAFLDCHAHRFPGETPAGRLFHIFRTNAYEVGSKSTTHQDATHWAMFPRMARINHSCRPNVASLWVPVSGGPGMTGHGYQVLWSTRAIAAGEELLVGYVNLLQDTAARRHSLVQYGFWCDCAVCRASLVQGADGSRAKDGDYDSDYSDGRVDSDDEARTHAGNLLRGLEAFLATAKDAHETGREAEEAVEHHLSLAGTLIRYFRDDVRENGGLGGYLPRAYALAASLERLATGNSQSSWGAEGRALLARLGE